MKVKGKEFIQYFVIFIFFMYIGMIIPYTGDDWGNVMHNGSFIGSLKMAIGCYKSFEGRFFSRIFVSILNYYKVLWVFINAISMTTIYYCLINLVKPKKFTFISILAIDLLLLIDEETFAQVYAWITGNITYLIPTAFLMFLIYFNRDIFYKKELSIKYPKIVYFILPILTFIFSMFVENVTLGIITALLLIIVYRYIFSKKVDIFNIICLIFSAIGFLLMLYSPGTINRATSISSFDNLNILEKIIITFPRQMNYVFIKNSFLVFTFIIFILNVVLKNYNGIKKIIIILFFTIIPFITILGNIYYTIYRYPPENFIGIFLDCNNWHILIYWIMFIIISIIIIIKKHIFDKSKALFFFIISIVNNAGMLVSPICGGRTAYLSTLMLIICVLILFDSLKIKLFDNKIVVNMHKSLLIVIILTFSLFYFKYYSLNIKKENYIKQQLYENKKIINVIKLPEKYLWNPNPWDETHMINFKKYYNIAEENQVKIKNVWECDL